MWENRRKTLVQFGKFQVKQDITIDLQDELFLKIRKSSVAEYQSPVK